MGKPDALRQTVNAAMSASVASSRERNFNESPGWASLSHVSAHVHVLIPPPSIGIDAKREAAGNQEKREYGGTVWFLRYRSYTNRNAMEEATNDGVRTELHSDFHSYIRDNWCSQSTWPFRWHPIILQCNTSARVSRLAVYVLKQRSRQINIL